MKSGMEWKFLRHNRSRLRSHRHHHVHIVQTCPTKNASLIRTRQNSCTGCSRHNQRKWLTIQCLANHLDRRRMKRGLFLPQQPKGRSTPARPSYLPLSQAQAIRRSFFRPSSRLSNIFFDSRTSF